MHELLLQRRRQTLLPAGVSHFSAPMESVLSFAVRSGAARRGLQGAAAGAAGGCLGTFCRRGRSRLGLWSPRASPRALGDGSATPALYEAQCFARTTNANSNSKSKSTPPVRCGSSRCESCWRRGLFQACVFFCLEWYFQSPFCSNGSSSTSGQRSECRCRGVFGALTRNAETAGVGSRRRNDGEFLCHSSAAFVRRLFADVDYSSNSQTPTAA